MFLARVHVDLFVCFIFVQLMILTCMIPHNLTTSYSYQYCIGQ